MEPIKVFGEAAENIDAGNVFVAKAHYVEGGRIVELVRVYGTGLAERISQKQELDGTE